MQVALRDFVPVAQDVQYTQYRSVDDEQTQFFARIMDQVRNFNGSDEKTTRQGFYAFDATGDVYGAMNRRSARRLVELLDRAKSDFAADPPPRINLPEAAPYARPKPPRGSAVVQVFARIDSEPARSVRGRRGRRDRGRRNERLGRDHLWVRPFELRQLAHGRMPDGLAGRLLLNHCLDNIRGEPDPWEVSHVSEANFEVTRSLVVRDGVPQIEVVLAGRFAMETGEREVGWRRPLPSSGYQGRMSGRLRFDAATLELLEWTAIAEGRAFGRSRYTNGEPAGHFPLRVAFVLSRDPRHVEVPPGMFFRGASAYWDPGLRLPVVPIH